jgi:cytochrome c551/c552
MRYAIPAVVLALGLLMIATPKSEAKAEFMKKEKKACTFCHTTAKGPELNDAGKYYKEKKTLEGYVAPKK